MYADYQNKKRKKRSISYIFESRALHAYVYHNIIYDIKGFHVLLFLSFLNFNILNLKHKVNIIIIMHYITYITAQETRDKNELEFIQYIMC
jgi:hypothetical protein